MTYAYDCHMHILPLSHIPLSAYLDFALSNGKEEAFAQFTTQNYVVDGILKKKGDALNLVNVFERRPFDVLALYEDDLRATYDGKLDPVINGGGICVKGAGKNLHYDRLVLCPQVMDFNLPKKLSTYYSDAPRHDIMEQAEEILSGIDEYRKKRPDGLLEIRPFIGINPLNYELTYIEDFLNRNFPKKHLLFGKKAKFTGIKVYPPLGFDPNPDDLKLREKNELLFTFCEEHKIPIVTHCDDQGFRVLPLEESFKYTSPERWGPVLKRHPELRIDFAHFGQQYNKNRSSSGGLVERLFGGKSKNPFEAFREMKEYRQYEWQIEILRLMREYPNVYSDMSFGGSDKECWVNLQSVLDRASDDERKIYESRILFGTDWPLNLVKIPSVLRYWHGFAESGLDSEFTDRMLRVNPENFLSGKKPEIAGF